MSKTLYEKIWNEHIVHQQDDGTTLLYVDRHLIHEVTSPQAFEGLRLSKRKVRKSNLTLAVADHNVPTNNRSKGIDDEESRIQVEVLVVPRSIIRCLSSEIETDRFLATRELDNIISGSCLNATYRRIRDQDIISLAEIKGRT